MDYPINQSTWGRAARDTATAQKTARFMWGGEGVLAVAGGAWFQSLAPVGAPTWEIVGRAVTGGLIGLIAAVLAIFTWNLFRAPYRQRNEARFALSATPSKRKAVTEKLAGFYISGRELSLKIAADDFQGDAISLVQDWNKPLMDYCYSVPDILGKTALVRLSPRIGDYAVFGASRLTNEQKNYAFKHLLIELEKLLDLVTELNK